MAVKRRSLVACAILVAGSALAAACGGSSSTGSSNGPGDTISADQLDPNATLRVALRRAAPTLDPARVPTTSDEAQLDMMYDKLFRMGPDGVVKGELVERWQYTPEGLVLHVRPGVVFQDGAKLDGAAVKANLDRSRTLTDSAVKGDLTPITDVALVDPMTVLLKTASKNVTIPAILSSRAGAMISPQAFDSPTLAQSPVGAGPFKVTAHTPGATMTLERWDGYWNPSVVDVAKLDVRFLPDATARMNAIRGGQVDAADVEADQIADAQAARFDVATSVVQTVTCIQVNSDLVPAFADERVRKAVNMAVDRAGIVKGVLRGHGETTSQFFPQSSIAFDRSLPDPFPFDAEQAKRLLVEAGHPNGITIEIVYGSVPSQKEMEAIAGSMAKAGVDLKLTPIQGNEGVARMWTQKSAQALAFPCNSQVDPSLALGTFLPGHLRNPANLTNDKVTALQKESLVEEDPAKRATILQQLTHELSLHPLSVISLYSNTSSFALAGKVVGFEMPPSNVYTFRGVGVTK